MTFQARDITATLRTLLPQVQPLTTATRLSGEGMVLGYEVRIPEAAARHIGAARLADTGWLNDYLSRHLDGEVHVADVHRTRRRDYSNLTHLVIETGPKTGT